MQLNIQMFGGRGASSGVKKKGIIFGKPELEASRGPIPVFNNYPDYPDPDYTNFKVKTKDKFINATYRMVDYKRESHYDVANSFLKSLNINKNVKLTNTNFDSKLGFVYVYEDKNGIAHVTKYNLSSADTRRMEYKVKTMIHEGIHAKMDGRKYNRADSKDNTINIEETRTEMAAMYLAHKINGFDYVASYPAAVALMAKKYIQLPEYSNCKTIYDLGEKFYKERFSGKDPDYKELQYRINKTRDLDFNKQNKFIEKHKDECYNAIRNKLFNWQYYNDAYSQSFEKIYDKLYDKIVSDDLQKLNGLEKTVYNECLTYAMAKEGI